MAAIQLKSSL
jgi:hypothetical protein